MSPETADLLADLDALIADETVRDRYIRLVRVRDGVDNLITSRTVDGE